MPSSRSVLTTTITVTSPIATTSGTASSTPRDAAFSQRLLIAFSLETLDFCGDTRMPCEYLRRNGSIVASSAHPGIYAGNLLPGDQSHRKHSLDFCNWHDCGRNCHHFRLEAVCCKSPELLF